MQRKKAQRKDKGSVNIGSIEDISGGTINIAGNDINQNVKVEPGRRTINTGGGAYIEGGVNTGGGDFVGRDQMVNQSSNVSVTPSPFDEIRKQIAQTSNVDMRATLMNAVTVLEKESYKGAQINEGLVKIWLTVLMTSSDDLRQVVQQAFRAPREGVSEVFTKMALSM